MKNPIKIVLLLLMSPFACALDNVSDSQDWRAPSPDDVLYMQLPSGVVVIELADIFAPKSAKNIRTLVKERYFDGLSIIRSHDNYVAQWGDPADEAAGDEAKSIGSATATVDPEFFRNKSGLNITPIDSRDAYADEVGFVDGFPMASDGKRAWLTHCYGMVGIGRGMELNSGNGSSLYAVTGHAPRHLDRNITLVGRVLYGIENLTALPRGTGPLGFYESADQYVPVESIRLGSDVDESERISLEVMRTDSASFADYVQGRTHRKGDWFVDPVGRIGLCNLHPPVRVAD